MKQHFSHRITLAKLMALLLFVLLMTAVNNAEATPETYTYTGNYFNDYTGSPYTTSDNVTVSFTADLGVGAFNDIYSSSSSSLIPFALSISAGGTGLSTNSADYYVLLAGSNGDITKWDIELDVDNSATPNSTSNYLETYSLGDAAGDSVETDSTDNSGTTTVTGQADIYSNPGTWSSVTPPSTTVPEPTTLLLVATGLGGLVATRKWKRS